MTLDNEMCAREKERERRYLPSENFGCDVVGGTNLSCHMLHLKEGEEGESKGGREKMVGVSLTSSSYRLRPKSMIFRRESASG